MYKDNFILQQSNSYFYISICSGMKIKDIINVLEKLAPPTLQEVYDNAGLITATGMKNAVECFVQLDVIEAVIEERLITTATL